MTRLQLLTLHADICESARSLMSLKNQDYGGNDVMGNLRLIEQLFPGDSIEKGIIIRMGDKLSRLAVLTTQPAAVTSEKLEDTAADIINYCILFLAARSLRTKDPRTEKQVRIDTELAKLYIQDPTLAPKPEGETGYPPGWTPSKP